MLKVLSVYNEKLIRAMQIQELKRYLKYNGADLILNIAVLAVLFRSGGFSVCRWLFCGLLLLQIAIVADLFYFSAARRYRAAGEGKDLRMEFTVSETGLDIVMKGEAFTAVAAAPFDSISKAVETASFIFYLPEPAFILYHRSGSASGGSGRSAPAALGSRAGGAVYREGPKKKAKCGIMRFAFFLLFPREYDKMSGVLRKAGRERRCNENKKMGLALLCALLFRLYGGLYQPE